jgi:hypothetical protein
MLSYAEHGKFRMPIQASDPFPARVSAHVPRPEWIMGCRGAQWEIAARLRRICQGLRDEQSIA